MMFPFFLFSCLTTSTVTTVQFTMSYKHFACLFALALSTAAALPLKEAPELYEIAADCAGAVGRKSGGEGKGGGGRGE